ncbi:hypothetical protein CONPUDRAFT_66965 [Coniophora puteana RWD-64-598 SS2]|uniref:CENP-V/GFA domain-containing protein n=1 Tax=Coniophora puteana (strain RWD-64-598) TaxID=741705 RepID=R7SEF0_CONPW|nr:uncharacterized protein CONPUDRAFT_66965 [Coniophora puteana RWD-64-598 SS2]EIW74558.1 hypothetical protein CONPUDRAFT_66965 [Coniophora puteana RWD-64-598 SS2]
MPVTLHGSCHCGAVSFTVESNTPVPYQLCVCSICRKVGGVGGSINLNAIEKTLKIKGKENITKYTPVVNRGTKDEYKASSERNFCKKCSAMLWLWDPHWPEYLHPFASAIDDELEDPKELVVVKLDSKPSWVRLPEGTRKDNEGYNVNPKDPEDYISIEQWHKDNGKWVD